jgi:RNA polymerase sigma-70 factor (family 1)|tara:strand:+ start:1191 stop:1778 length:588 start_codon:yes stop_codon:yes gene_type:complete
MQREANEREVLFKLSAGDRFAFGVLFNMFYSKLYYFALHYLNDEENSKDVVQDVFSFVWEDRQKLSEVRDLSAWLYTLTKYQCLKKIEHLKVKQKHSDNLRFRELSIVQNSLNDLDTSPVIIDEINQIIEKCLGELSPQSKRIFELSRFENKKNREIAMELNISTKAVEAHITKVLKLLRIALKNYLPLVLFLFR